MADVLASITALDILPYSNHLLQTKYIASTQIITMTVARMVSIWKQDHDFACLQDIVRKKCSKPRVKNSPRVKMLKS